MNACGGLSAVAHGAHDQVGTADEIATGEHAGDTGHLVFVHDYAAPFVDFDVVGIPGGENWDRVESVGNQNRRRPAD